MYRFIGRAPTRATGSTIIPRSACSLCNRGHTLISDYNLLNRMPSLTRNLTTDELSKIASTLQEVDKQKKNQKNYAELIEVKSDNTNFKKATIQNLSPKTVSKLMRKPESSLEKLHLSLGKKKKSSETSVTEKLGEKFFHKRVLSNFEDECDHLLDEYRISLIRDEDLIQKSKEETELSVIWHNTENIDMFAGSELECGRIPDAFDNNLTDSTSEVVKNVSPKKKLKKSNPQTEKAKSERLNKVFENALTATINKQMALAQASKDLSKQSVTERYRKLEDRVISFIELCVACDFLNLAFHTMDRCIKKHRFANNWMKFRCSDAFDKLLYGYAAKGNSNKVGEVLKMMELCGIQPSLQTFAGYLECMGRLTVPPSVTELEKMHHQFSGFKLSFQDIMIKCKFVRDQREYVLKGIRLLEPNFIPQYEPPVLHYSNRLVNVLNESTNFRSPCEELLTDQQMREFVNEQCRNEFQLIYKVKSIHKSSDLSEETLFYRNEWTKLQDQWRKSIEITFEKNLQHQESHLKETKQCYDPNILPYLKLLDREQYVGIIMMEIRRLLQGSETYSPSVFWSSVELGRQVLLRCDLQHKKQSNVTSYLVKIYKQYCQWYLHPETNTESANCRHRWQRLLFENADVGPSLSNDLHPCPVEMLADVGRFLYRIILDNLKFNACISTSRKNEACYLVPVFYETLRTRGQYPYYGIKPHPKLMEFYMNTSPEELYFDVDLLPMVSPPLPWTTKSDGGYLFKKAPLIRMYVHGMGMVSGTPNKQLYPVFDSLNQLSSVPWRINEKVLDVMLAVFTKGGSEKLNVPRPASSFNRDEIKQKFTRKLSSTAEQLYITQRKAEMHSLWCEALYRLSLANHYRDRIFWLPHNLDFRGRVYPVPPHLTHLGSDLARSLLRFAKGEKLGPKGLDWLKIHCINLTGLKKKTPTQERLNYANEILSEILDSAERPLTGRMWWTQSEDLWQTLASCMEIKAALDSGDQENFVSHFPIHQDGSCNGLQHYAALGRDQAGAESVNLTPSSKPQDVYSCVVALVENERQKDAAAGLPIAKSLEGIIERKIIKQTIMTTVYGVTKYGARRQIEKQLKDVEGLPVDSLWQGSKYLADKTFDCLREMFTSTRQIQNWFTDCATLISSLNSSCVAWRTPLGMDVVQPYTKQYKPNTLKQKHAFPPNYIHSLDSSHMMLTSLFCEKKGITFISVHDCFWTHACSVETMNKICREQFVSLHSQPLLEDLSAFFIQRYVKTKDTIEDVSLQMVLPHDSPYIIFTQIPKRGSFSLMDVLKSEYFFS